MKIGPKIGQTDNRCINLEGGKKRGKIVNNSMFSITYQAHYNNNKKIV